MNFAALKLIASDMHRKYFWAKSLTKGNLGRTWKPEEISPVRFELYLSEARSVCTEIAYLRLHSPMVSCAALEEANSLG